MVSPRLAMTPSSERACLLPGSCWRKAEVRCRAAVVVRPVPRREGVAPLPHEAPARRRGGEIRARRVASDAGVDAVDVGRHGLRAGLRLELARRSLRRVDGKRHGRVDCAAVAGRVGARFGKGRAVRARRVRWRARLVAATRRRQPDADRSDRTRPEEPPCRRRSHRGRFYSRRARTRRFAKESAGPASGE